MKEEKRKREHRDEESERKEWTYERERRQSMEESELPYVGGRNNRAKCIGASKA